MKKDNVLNILMIFFIVLIGAVLFFVFNNKKEVKNNDLVLYENSITIRKGSIHILKTNMDDRLIWNTSNSEVATVDDRGVVHAIDYGETTISVIYTSESGEVYKKECNVVVYNGDLGVSISNISIDQGDLILSEGKSYDIKNAIIVNPSNGYISDMSFNNSDDNVISVNDGLISFKSIGKSIVTVKVNNQYETKINVYCVDENNISKFVVNPTGITINNKNMELYVGDEAIINYELTPINASSEFIKFVSSNNNIAYVNEKGYIEAKNEGNVSVSIESLNGVLDEINLSIKIKPTPTPTPVPTPTPSPTPSPTPKNSNNNNNNNNNNGGSSSGRTCKLSDDPQDSYYNSCINSSKNLVISSKPSSIRVGQSVTIHVTLPNCGRFIKYTRTTADGSSGWSRYISQSRSGLNSSGFDWIITGKSKGSTCASQTVQFDVYSPSGKCSANIKSMKTICFDVI